MLTLETNGISLSYDTFGDRSRPPLMLIIGLGGVGAAFGPQIELFARHYFVIVADHRGAGRSSRPADGYTVANHAIDMASLIEHLGVGPTHLVGSSTGGCIALQMALDHAHTVRSAVVASSFSHMDDYMLRQFALRRQLTREAEPRVAHEAGALFLFAPRYASEHAEAVKAWIDRLAALPFDRDILIKRIEMIMAFDIRARLADIRKPVLVLCGDQDLCTPLHLSEGLARAVPGAGLSVMPGGGHFIYLEQPQAFCDAVSRFIAQH